MVEFEGELDIDPIVEYWVVAFFKSKSKNKLSYRQFLAAGYYEAYDRVMTFAEKTGYHILWFKEKRNCGIEFMGRVLPGLENLCTFCNKEFNNTEPIKCNFRGTMDVQCRAEFCSLHCKEEHFYFRHVRSSSNI
jgi:hypothetical protein